MTVSSVSEWSASGSNPTFVSQALMSRPPKVGFVVWFVVN